jgi:serine/threonine protein kinase/energy-coupling factor transporter ATP-binding protein EcfA2
MTLADVDRQEPVRLGRPGLVVDGRYRLEDKLGAGGFGEVWRATQEVEGESVRDVALKILLAPPDESGTPRTAKGGASTGSSSGDGRGWLNEVRAIREVHCDAVTTIYDVGIAREPRVAFIAMELLRGETVHDRLERDGPIYWRRALAIAKEIARALHVCHAVDVAHCDLKPHNVFLTETGRVCVLDFGIAALGAEAGRSAGRSIQSMPAASDEMFMDGTGAVSLDELPDATPLDSGMTLVGTPGYIAPEGYSGGLPGAPADAYALGVCLYKMITGLLPFRLSPDVPDVSTATTKDDMSRYWAALSTAAIRGDLIPLRDTAPDTPRAVRELIEQLLSTEPDTRPTKNLVEALDEVWRRPHGVPEPPYVGLEAFDQSRTGFIAGRDADIADITDKLRDQRAVVLCGPSGCGKSSLAAAGVVAHIDEELLDDLDGWRSVVIRPTGSQVLERVDEPADHEHTDVGLVVVVDQLEEVVTLDDDERLTFCDALATMAEGSGAVRVDGRVIASTDPVRVVATVRDDLFGRVAALPELRRFPERNLFTVRGVEPNAIPDIVAAPAEAAGYELENRDAVAHEAADILNADASALPLVQFALTRWWEARDRESKRLTEAEWNKIGGIEGALAEAAQTMYDQFTSDEREHMKNVLVELFRADGTRRVVPEGSVARDAGARGVLDRLLEGRLIRRQESDSGATLEVVHEALARRWPKLHTWLEDTRTERELIDDVQYDAKRWNKQQRDDMLWSGRRLEEVAELKERKRIGPDAHSFIEHSQRRVSRSKRTRMGVIGVVALLLLLVAAAGASYLLSNQERKKAETAKKEAIAERDKNEQLKNAAEEAKRVAVSEKEEADEAREAAKKAAIDADEARELAEGAATKIQSEKDETEKQRQRADEEAGKAKDEAAKAAKAEKKAREEAEKAKTAEQKAKDAEQNAKDEAKKARTAEALAKKETKKLKKAQAELEAQKRELRKLREGEGIGEPTFP